MKTLLSLLLLFYGSFWLIGQRPSCQAQHQEFQQAEAQFKSGNEGMRSDTVDVLNYDIYLDFTNADAGTISGFCEVKFSPFLTISSISLDLLKFKIDSIVMHGNQIPFSYNDTLIVAQFGAAVLAGRTDSLTVYYQGKPQLDPSGWGGFYMSGGYYYNLGVGFESYPHNYGRAWHPCFDNFVERATYRFQILTDDGNTAYCNGTRKSVTPFKKGKLLTFWDLRDEIPSYLAGVAVSSYTHVEQNYFSPLYLRNTPIWLVANAADTVNLKKSFVHLKNALEAFETFYGRYRWERIGYVMIPFSSGAMEHATNIAYPVSAVNGTTSSETLMAHELSHHWWGNHVTCKTAEEMWINEGLAKYSEHLFTEWVYSYDAYMAMVRNNHYDVLRNAHIEDGGYYSLNAVPVKHTYGEHSYNKGADAMHTLRSYMGDEDFYAGLHAIQTVYAGQHITSEAFMSQLNTTGPDDVTDFFNAWIFQPGFAHFSIAGFTSTPKGEDYLVSVIVGQKLKAAAAYHKSVPLQITFMDARWNVHTAEVIFSDAFDAFDITVPFDPVFVGINLNEKINDATTAITETIDATGTYFFNYANTYLQVKRVKDSALVRIEHNWVHPDLMDVPENIQISQERYWNIHGVDLDNITGNLRFEYNGKNGYGGNLDTELLTSWGGNSFVEDSIVLLYRPDASSDWKIHADYAIAYNGSHTDKAGYITTGFFAAGQYAFGYRTDSVAFDLSATPEKTWSALVDGFLQSLIVDLTNWPIENLQIQIVEIGGKVAMRKEIKGGQRNTVDLSEIENSTYLVLIMNTAGQVLGSKRIVIN